MVLPGEAAFDRPPQDARSFGLELFEEPMVLLVIRDRDGERQQANAAPDRVIRPADHGAVVRGKEQLERRLELKILRPHEPCGEDLAARHLLHQTFGQALAGGRPPQRSRTAAPSTARRRSGWRRPS
jgi:hypothetical protein